MADTIKLKRRDVANEVKRIENLPEAERGTQMKALQNRVSYKIETTIAKINSGHHSIWMKRKEVRRLVDCASALPKEYRKSIYDIWGKTFDRVLAPKNADMAERTVKRKTAHVSGLPLPKQAEVNVWWHEKTLMLQSAATQFSLPAERIIGLGTTTEVTAASLYGAKTYLTIEYEKEGEIKYIVVNATWRTDFHHIINYFNRIKGKREMKKQAL